MIDPAAHGGHPHTDLGMLALFGAPYIEEIFRGYGAPKDIETWIPMHQLHPLAVHALTHGSAYNRPLERAALARWRRWPRRLALAASGACGCRGATGPRCARGRHREPPCPLSSHRCGRR